MATIKAYTTIEQSKKLLEILGPDSADMYYDLEESNIPNFIYGSHSDFRCFTMCWSLAALLSILTEQDFIIKTIGNEFNIDIPIRHCKIWFSSLLDAAFEMVVWLKENGKI